MAKAMLKMGNTAESQNKADETNPNFDGSLAKSIHVSGKVEEFIKTLKKEFEKPTIMVSGIPTQYPSRRMEYLVNQTNLNIKSKAKDLGITYVSAKMPKVQALFQKNRRNLSDIGTRQLLKHQRSSILLALQDKSNPKVSQPPIVEEFQNGRKFGVVSMAEKFELQNDIPVGTKLLNEPKRKIGRVTFVGDTVYRTIISPGVAKLPDDYPLDAAFISFPGLAMTKKNVKTMIEILKQQNYERTDVIFVCLGTNEIKRALYPWKFHKCCYNCSEIGHVANVCKNKTACSRCAGEHLLENCMNTEQKCANCLKNNVDDVCHSAFSYLCPYNN